MKKSNDLRLIRPAYFFLLLFVGISLVGCAGKKTMITSNGLHGIKLGDQLPAVGTESLKGVSLRDTLLEDKDYTWRAALMEYTDGLVYLEEDFSRGETLNRIRVETPELKLKNGLRVGKTVGDLQKIKGEWYINPLTDFEVFDFYTRLMPNIHFLVADAKTDMSDPDWKNYKMDMFDPEAQIVAIVIF